MLKLLFPSWAFFDSSGNNLRLEISKSQSPTAWERLPAPPSRKPWNLFLNEKHNHYLYLYTLMDRFLDNDLSSKSKEFQILWKEIKRFSDGARHFRILLDDDDDSQNLVFSTESLEES